MNISERIKNDSQRSIYQKYAVQLEPFDVIEFGKALGLEVKESDTMPARVSGLITKIDGKYVICVNKSESIQRKRFTVAHEIGHYLLHSDQFGDGLVDSVDSLNRDGRAHAIEYEANDFAANLLMPERRFRMLWEDQTSSVVVIATFFLVSDSAVMIRAKSLGLAKGSSDYFA